VRRAASPAKTPLAAWDATRKLLRIAFITAWTDADVARYIKINGPVINPPAQDGYTSMGLTPCTTKASHDDPWAGVANTECGIEL
jgi:3'-phosphoadenosine 5'-phosphosulfate sulfotransferase (PAPS reductase)/FAD synthetase